MPRIALTVAYNGRHYHGWQYQGEDTPTVQKELTRAVSQVADCQVSLHCAGRTDTGVHATSQVVHFDSPVERHDKAWVKGSNVHLPEDVSVHWAGVVSGDFDARRSATARRYLYLIHNAKIRSALMADFLTHEHRSLDAAVMNDAAQSLLGENDFSSFRAANCQSVSPMRNVISASVKRVHDLVAVEITANAFLHHMVRNIVGVLVDIGAGEKPVDWTRELLELKDRSQAGRTAPANGLSLVQVYYPEQYGIPGNRGLPHFFGSLADAGFS